MIDWIADYRERVAELPVRSPVEPGAVRARLPASPPREPQTFDAIFQDLEEILVPGDKEWRADAAQAERVRLVPEVIEDLARLAVERGLLRAWRRVVVG